MSGVSLAASRHRRGAAAAGLPGSSVDPSGGTFNEEARDCFAPTQVRDIVMSMSLLSVRSHLENTCEALCTYILPLAVARSASGGLRYVMYFRFCG